MFAKNIDLLSSQVTIFSILSTFDKDIAHYYPYSYFKVEVGGFVSWAGIALRGRS